MNANEATMGGAGTVTRKATAGLQAQQPVLRMVVEIKRASTGKVETYELIGTPVEEKEQ
jgi:hypothetical protein